MKKWAGMNFHGTANLKNYFCLNLHVINQIGIVDISEALFISMIMQLLLVNSWVEVSPQIIFLDSASGIESQSVLSLYSSQRVLCHSAVYLVASFNSWELRVAAKSIPA